MEIATPYLLFLGDVPDALAAKTALGIVDWRPEWCLGQLRLAGCKADAKIPDMTISEAKAAGVRTMIVGAVNAGGVLPEHWIASIVEALDAGFDVASGLHSRLGDQPAIRAAAERSGGKLHDVRHSTQRFATGKGTKRDGLRLLTVGTDCSVGKKYTALALERGMRAAGFDADFRATGQTGIMIAGAGIAVDAVIADFIAGAAECISPEAAPEHWDLIEGQGSLFHPAYAGVTLGLLHGSQADGLILCHDPLRTHLVSWPDYPVPGLAVARDLYLQAARLTNPGARLVGVSLNTSAMDDAAAQEALERAGRELGVPAFDPMRSHLDQVVASIMG